MNEYVILLLLVIVLCGVASCSTPFFEEIKPEIDKLEHINNNAKEITMDNLNGKYWVYSINGNFDIACDITIHNDRISGICKCNRFTGDICIKNHYMLISEIIDTRVHCNDDFTSIIIQTLYKVVSYDYTNGIQPRISLYDVNDNHIMTLIKHI